MLLMVRSFDSSGGPAEGALLQGFGTCSEAHSDVHFLGGASELVSAHFWAGHRERGRKKVMGSFSGSGRGM